MTDKPIIEDPEKRLNKTGGVRRIPTPQEHWLDFAWKLEGHTWANNSLLDLHPPHDFTDEEKAQILASIDLAVSEAVTQLRRIRSLFESDGSTCNNCGDPIASARSDARYCSPACRQKAYRRRTSTSPQDVPTSQKEMEKGVTDRLIAAYGLDRAYARRLVADHYKRAKKKYDPGHIYHTILTKLDNGTIPTNQHPTA